MTRENGIAGAWPVLPPVVERTLRELIGSASSLLGSELVSVVLFGSGAEGRLRATSDVNVLVVLRSFPREGFDKLAPGFAAARASIRLSPMFVLDSELPGVMEAFAVKFADIRNRHCVLHGSDPFGDLAPSRQAEIGRVRQVLLNLAMRMRAEFVAQAGRGEALARAVADHAGPLRASASVMLAIEGRPAASPKEALAALAASVAPGRFDSALGSISKAREEGMLDRDRAVDVFLEMIELAKLLYARASALS